MRKVALRGLFARKTRLALTALAVALGVTLMAGTYVFTDTINHSFDKIFAVSYKGTDVVITPNDDLTSDNSNGPAPLDASILDRVRRLPGVAEAEGSIFDGNGAIIGRNGKPVSSGGAPTFVAGTRRVHRFDQLQYAQGRPPRTADEVAIDKGLADRKHFKPGDRIGVQDVAPRKTYTITGVVKIAGVDSLGGAAMAIMIPQEAARMSGKVGKFDEIDLATDGTVAPTALRAEIRRMLPRSIDVRTGDEQAKSQSKDIRDNLGFLQTALLAFAGIALFVGAFIIFNTFSITVAQRAREFALLRTLGATRGQVLRSVLAEGVTLGVLGSLVGLGLGIGAASGLRALFKGFGIDLPSTGTVVESRTIIVSLLVGTIVTIVASIAPALRATRVPPVAALREGVALPETRSSRLAFPLAIVLTVLGLALMATGLFAVSDETGALSLMGGGAAATFLGVGLMSPKLVGPIASAVGRPIESLFGITGRLARENSVRQPGRTAATAAALMIGVALVTFASIFAASAKTTVRNEVDRGLKGDAVVQNQNGFGEFSPEVAPTLAKVPGVKETASLRFGKGRVAGVAKSSDVSAVDPQTFPDLYRIEWKDGSDAAIRGLGDTGVVVTKGFSKDHGFHVGDTLRVKTSSGRTDALTVRGVVDDKAHLLSDLTISNALGARDFGLGQDSFVFVGYQPGANAKQVKAAIDRIVDRNFPQAEALTGKEFKDDQAGQIDQVLALIYALLALSIIVSLFGIVNTLVLSITERTRELGMLRAIGTSRKQVRKIIRYESVITALIGGILGTVVGIVLALLVEQPIDDFTLSVPVPNLVLVLVLAAIAGMLAAILPARRAARLDVLKALAYE